MTITTTHNIVEDIVSKLPTFTPPEDRQDFLAALAKAACSLTDDDWDSLSKETVSWVTEAADSVKFDKPIRDFEKPMKTKKTPLTLVTDPVETQEVTVVVTDEPQPVEKSTKTRTTKAGTSEFFRGLIIDFPGESRKALVMKASEQGFPIPTGTASTIFYETKATINLLQKKGKKV